MNWREFILFCNFLSRKYRKTENNSFSPAIKSHITVWQPCWLTRHIPCPRLQWRNEGVYHRNDLLHMGSEAWFPSISPHHNCSPSRTPYPTAPQKIRCKRHWNYFTNYITTWVQLSNAFWIVRRTTLTVTATVLYSFVKEKLDTGNYL